MENLEILERIRESLKIDGRLCLIDKVRCDKLERDLRAFEFIKKMHLFRFYEDGDIAVAGFGFKTKNKEEYEILKDALDWKME